MYRKLLNKFLKNLSKTLKILYKIGLVLNIPVILNILYYAIITPNSFEFDKIVPRFVKYYNWAIGVYDIFYFLLLIILFVILKIINKFKRRKNNLD